MPLFSVIIPVYNRPDSISAAIQSVLDQTWPDYELIVIDDGSTDDTDLRIKKFSSSICYFYQQNKGVSAARNLGIEKAQGRHLCFLDSDDTWHRDKLQSHNDFLEKNSHIKIHQTEDIWMRNNKRVNPKNKHLKPSGRIFLRSLDMCLISPSSVCIEKNIFTEHGVFNEKLPACEDYDLWLRLTAHHEIGLIQKKLITRYSGHADQLSSSFAVMDRFRVYAILKLLQNTDITEEYTIAAQKTAIHKLVIMKQGAEKRERLAKAEFYDSLISSVKNQDYNHIDYESLLSE